MNWRESLRAKAVLIADGAWGTEFQKLGLEAGEALERLNAERPDEVAKVASSYVEAGSDIVLTNTFGASRWKLERAGLGERAAELNRLGVEISARVAAGRALVFASVGPVGELMEPLGTRSEDEFIACFAEQIRACAEGGADALVIETQTDLGEVRAAVKAARQSCALPVVVSMTFEPGARGFATVMGVRPAQAAEALDAAGADIVGSNCGTGIADMIAIAAQMRPATSKPLWFKANAGVPELDRGKTVFRETPDYMASRAEELIEAGASIIGGCCGTTPEHIRRMAETADTLRDVARRVSEGVLAGL